MTSSERAIAHASVRSSSIAVALRAFAETDADELDAIQQVVESIGFA